MLTCRRGPRNLSLGGRHPFKQQDTPVKRDVEHVGLSVLAPTHPGARATVNGSKRATTLHLKGTSPGCGSGSLLVDNEECERLREQPKTASALPNCNDTGSYVRIGRSAMLANVGSLQLRTS